ncbi:hypothetical protein LAZ67_9000665 [Cordylochernes scorpioides]|uniref:Mariner Mos1 transposase n=1 Tax=Cordylochernes scorpioides TaxID=51811 RepID=A0ABY6KXN3_9ARAC|nr:hypothetical protein LAZ67_9000665 [Cordylochernes scorpioides]
MSKWRIKTMIIVFFDIRGIVHCEFVPQGQIVNSAFYLEVLRRLKRRIARVRTDIKDTVKLHHDNATSHTAFIITNFLAQSNTPVIPHPPYSPDLAPLLAIQAIFPFEGCDRGDDGPCDQFCVNRGKEGGMCGALMRLLAIQAIFPFEGCDRGDDGPCDQFCVNRGKEGGMCGALMRCECY